MGRVRASRQHSCEQDGDTQMQHRVGGGAGEEETLKKNRDSEEILENSESPTNSESLHLQVPFSHPRPCTVEPGCPFPGAGRKDPWASS